MRLIRSLALPLMLILAPLAARADAAGIDRLLDTLRMSDLLEIMAEEGARHAAQIETDMFPGAGGPTWAAEAARIHDADRARVVLRDKMAPVLTGDDLAAVQAFFDGDLGQRIVAAEIATRRAFLDPDIERAAEELARDRRYDDPDRAARIARYISVNTLVDQNVIAGLNSTLALYRGLQAGDAFGGAMSDMDILREVRRGEDEMRKTTEVWLQAYLGLAYDGLSDAEFDRFLAFSETDAGQAFNAALFAGFGALFEAQSLAIGQAAARYMGGSEL